MIEITDSIRITHDGGRNWCLEHPALKPNKDGTFGSRTSYHGTLRQALDSALNYLIDQGLQGQETSDLKTVIQRIDDAQDAIAKMFVHPPSHWHEHRDKVREAKKQAEDTGEPVVTARQKRKRTRKTTTV